MLPGVDWTPLNKAGIDDDGKKRLMLSLMPIIQVELKEKIQSEFSPEDIKRVNDKAAADKVKPEEGVFLLEEEYHQKTGRYFMEEMRLLLNEYVEKLALAFEGAKQEAEEIANLPKDQLDKLQSLLTDKKWEEAVKFLEGMNK